MGKKGNGEKEARELVWAKTSDPRIKRRGKTLWARFSRYGLRIEQRLHETNMAAAIAATNLIEQYMREGRDLSEIKAFFNKSITQMPKDAVLIGELWPDFISYKKEGDQRIKLKPWRDKTLKEYVSFWGRSFEYFWSPKLPSEIEKYWDKFIEAERARSPLGAKLGFEHHIKYFKTFCNWLYKTGRIHRVPILADPNWVADEDEVEDDKVVFSDKCVRAMLENSRGAFGVYIRGGLLQGMRSSEMTQLKKDRIDLKKKIIRLRASDVKTGSKTNKGRVIPLHPDIVGPLKAQIEASGDSEYLFPNRKTPTRPMDPQGFRKHWTALQNKVGFTEGTPHSMRRTYATKAFSIPYLNPVLVCKALGMGMSTAMKHYIRFTDDQLSLVSMHFSYDNTVALGTGLGQNFKFEEAIK